MSGLAVASNSLLSFAQDEPEFLTVDQAFVFNFLQNEQGLKLSWQVMPEHYIYKERISFKTTGLSVGDIDYPKAKSYQDEYFGEVEIYDHSFSLQVPLSQLTTGNSFSVTYQGCAKAGLCYPPKTQKVFINSNFGQSLSHDPNATSKLEPKSSSEPILSDEMAVNTATRLVNTQFDAMSFFDKVTNLQYLTQVIDTQSLMVTLLLFFLLGLGLAFTPCVYPMFPILSRIIIGQSGQLSTKGAFRLSFFYVQGMAVTYMLLGVLAAFVGGGLNATLQQPIVIVPIAVMFVFLSLSMFGFYNLALPASWQQKLNSVSDKQKSGSVVGVFIMGAISGLVCSPCATAPLVAVIGFIAQSQDMILGGSILYILALGMGLPLLVIGTGGAHLLPKAGAWMDLVKAIFGFALLSVAIIFVERLISPLLASLLWAGLAIVLLGYFYHQNLQSKVGPWQTVRAIVLFLALSFTAIFLYNTIYPTAKTSLSSELTTQNAVTFIQVSSVAELDEQLKMAQQQGKRVMLDYYADWCVACKEFEHKTFSDSKVQAVLANMVLLQVDMTQASDETAAFYKKFDVFGLPSLIFIDKQQEVENSRVTGFMDAQRFLRHLNKQP